jgi:hypothetical protein
MIWRLMLPILCVQILVDGFFIYWIYQFKGMHFVKDALLILTYLFLFMKEPVRLWFDRLGKAMGPGVVFAMGMLAVIGLLQIFNPLAPGLLRGILGLKIMFLPWAFILLGFIYADDETKIEGLFRIVAFVSIPINIFGLMQFFNESDFMVRNFGPGFIYTTQIANIYGVKSTESFVRIIGTFPSSAHYAQFLGMNTLFCYALLQTNRKQRPVFLAILVLNIFALLGTGSRGGFLALILMMLLMGFLSRKLGFMVIAALIFIATVTFGFQAMGKNVAKRFESTTKAGKVRERTIEATPRLFLELLEKDPLGRGIGAASQAARHLGGQEGKFQLIENYLSKLQFEIGVMGVAVFYIFIFCLLSRWFNEWLRAITSANLYILALAMTAYSTVELTVGVLFSGIDTPPNSLYLWLFIGITARIWTYNKPQFQRL